MRLIQVPPHQAVHLLGCSSRLTVTPDSGGAGGWQAPLRERSPQLVVRTAVRRMPLPQAAGAGCLGGKCLASPGDELCGGLSQAFLMRSVRVPRTRLNCI